MLAHIKKLDWLLVASALTLVSFGLVSLYGGGGELVNFKKQILWLATGLFLMVAISFFDYRILRDHQRATIAIYIVSVFLLLGVLMFGVSIRGAESWYRVGFVTIEPVEFVKIALIVVLAKYFSMRHIEMYRLRHVVASGVYVCIPAFLVLLQAELGSLLIFGSTWVGVMVFAGIRIKHLALLALVGLASFFIAWNFVFYDYQKERLTAFLNPNLDPRGAGYNALQSGIAIGSAGVWGKGVGQGTQVQLGFLPEAQTDFIYAAITEEMGLVGASLLLLCFLYLFRRLMRISGNSPNNFARLVASGFALMLVTQMGINVGMNLGVLPIAGIPLPFVSYGGSSLVSLFVMLGVVQSIKIR